MDDLSLRRFFPFRARSPTAGGWNGLLLSGPVSPESPEDQFVDQPVASVSLAVRFFGGAAIEEGGRPVASRAGQRHPLALLALLSTAPGRSMSRDKLMAFLWPDADPASLRHRLSVTVYEIRRALGRDAIASVQDDLCLNADALWLDVVRFEEAMERGDMEEAIELHRGPFLDGFHLPDSAEFADWATAERERLARSFARALEGLAAKAEREGDSLAAVRLRRRVVEQDPYGSAATLALMRGLEAAGRRGEALRAAERHARALKEELGAGPDVAVEALARELRASPAPERNATSGPPPIEAASSPYSAAPEPPPRSEDAAPGPLATRPDWKRAGVAALVGIAIVAAVFRWLPSGQGVADEVVPDRVTVLPFVVRGSDEFAYLGDGMAEILGTTLDGVGAIRTADPHAVLSFVRESGLDPADPETGRRAADRFHAGRFVLGSIVESGGRIHVQATLYRVDGSIEARAAAGAGEDAEFFTMVDDLTRRLLVPRFDPEEERLARLAVTTSSSLAALREYLEGESRYRAGEFGAATEAFRRATREDSTFALAWYRMAVAAEWAFQPHDAAIAVERAVELADRLPERDRLLLVGWDAYARGQADRAEALYLRILDDRPEEVEGWLQLGEIRFHYAPARGRTIADSRAAFERVLSLDPSHEGARIHLARVAALQRDIPALERHVAWLVRRDPRSQASFEARGLRAFTARDTAAAQRLAGDLLLEDSYAALGVLMGQFHVGNVAGIAWGAELLAESRRPLEVQTAGRTIRALAMLATGRREAAAAAVSDVEALDPLRGGELRALFATMPFLEAGIPELEAARAALDRGEGSLAESFFLPDHDGVRPLLRGYLRGLVSAGLGDAATAGSRAKELERSAGPRSDPYLPRDLARGIRAEVHRRAGRTATALAALDSIREPEHYELVLPSPFHPRVRERYLRARLLEDAGRLEEARAVYASTGNRSLYDLPYRAPVLRQLAGLLERGGDARASAEAWRDFATLWADADPQLQAAVAAARRRAADPADTPGG
jgi:DNA-binding SARP family transcriptional activator